MSSSSSSSSPSPPLPPSPPPPSVAPRPPPSASTVLVNNASIYTSNVQRRQWNLAPFDERAALLASSSSSSSSPSATAERQREAHAAAAQRTFLQARTSSLLSSPPSLSAGAFHCAVCNVTLRDSLVFMDHCNGREHQRRMGRSMLTKRASLEDVQETLQRMEREWRRRYKCVTMQGGEIDFIVGEEGGEGEEGNAEAERREAEELDTLVEKRLRELDESSSSMKKQKLLSTSTPTPSPRPPPPHPQEQQTAGGGAGRAVEGGERERGDEVDEESASMHALMGFSSFT